MDDPMTSWEAECKRHRDALFKIAGALGMHVELDDDDTMRMPCGSDILAELEAKLGRPSVTEDDITAACEAFSESVSCRHNMQAFTDRGHMKAALEAAASRAAMKLEVIGDYMRNLGKATGDWSVASPVLEIIHGDF